MEWIRGEVIGHGAFASINLALPGKKSPHLPPVMAVKSCDLSESATLMNERDVLRCLGECPQIIRCFGADRTVEGGSERYNLLLEYAPGGSLVDEMSRRGGKLPEPEVRRHARSVLEAVRHIHYHGFVHSDIKIQNILVFPPVNGCGATEVKVADFGLASKLGLRRVQSEKGEDERRHFQWRGTPLYMSPEALNENEYEAPSDTWALGCAVLEMATGRPAWDHPADSNVYQLMMRIGVGDETPIIPEDLSEEGKDFLRKCFVKDPAKRWTAEMLLSHPFVAHHSNCGFVLPPPSPSPRSHFDFMDWDSSIQSPWEFRQDRSRFMSFGDSDTHGSLLGTIESLAFGEMPDWDDSESCWFIVR